MSGTRSFSCDLLDSHQGLLFPQQHGSFAATRVVLSVLQDARSCAEVAHAVLGMRSLKDGVTFGGRCGKFFQQCGAVGCLRLPAKLTPHVSFSGFCHKWLPDICRPCWVLCFVFTQEDDLRFERTAA